MGCCVVSGCARQTKPSQAQRRKRRKKEDKPRAKQKKVKPSQAKPNFALPTSSTNALSSLFGFSFRYSVCFLFALFAFTLSLWACIHSLTPTSPSSPKATHHQPNNTNQASPSADTSSSETRNKKHQEAKLLPQALHAAVAGPLSTHFQAPNHSNGPLYFARAQSNCATQIPYS